MAMSPKKSCEGRVARGEGRVAGGEGRVAGGEGGVAGGEGGVAGGGGRVGGGAWRVARGAWRVARGAWRVAGESEKPEERDHSREHWRSRATGGRRWRETRGRPWGLSYRGTAGSIWRFRRR